MPETVPDPAAPLGRSDRTRRWRLCFADGGTGFPGLTPVEADRVGARLDGLPGSRRRRCLVAVELGVVLSDGAGPYLVDADGALVLVVGPHPAMPGSAVAMGPAEPGTHRVGAVTDRGGGVWEWLASGVVSDGRRIAALDDLADVEDAEAVTAWERRWSSTGGAGVP